MLLLSLVFTFPLELCEISQVEGSTVHRCAFCSFHLVLFWNPLNNDSLFQSILFLRKTLLKESYWLTWNFFGISWTYRLLSLSRSSAILLDQVPFPWTSTLFSCLQAFVVFVTMCREAYDDFVRFRRDREVNSQQYKKLTKKGDWIVGIQNNSFHVCLLHQSMFQMQTTKATGPNAFHPPLLDFLLLLLVALFFCQLPTLIN